MDTVYLLIFQHTRHSCEIEELEEFELEKLELYELVDALARTLTHPPLA